MATTATPEHVLFIPSALADIPLLLTSLGYDDRFIDHHQDKVAYLLHLIVTLPHFHTHTLGYTQLCQQHLKRVMNPRYINLVLNLLQAAGVVECDGYFVPAAGAALRAKALGYRIAPQFMSKLIQIGVQKEAFARTLTRTKQAAAHTFAKNSQLGKIWSDLRQLRVRYQPAMALNETIYETTKAFLDDHFELLTTPSAPTKLLDALEVKADQTSKHITLLSSREVRSIQRKNPAVTTYEVLLQSAHSRYLANQVALYKIHTRTIPAPLRPVEGSRVYTILTSLSTSLRNYLYHAKHDTTALVNSDIANSQPFFLNPLLVDKYRGQPLPVDVQHYMELTSSGRFYEHVANAMGTPLDPVDKRQRRQFKGKFFSSLFFCKTAHTEASAIGRYFRQAFPDVEQLIREQKQTHYAHLAINMQRAEAQMIVDKVVKTLQRQGIWCCSIHDSIVSLPVHQPRVKELLESLFLKQFNLRPTVSQEALVCCV